ncbi:MAG TPA: class I SAM-dependent methyltransferase [Acidisoma sp.]|jgi:trans-aconitate methyltransferase|nr:class I SAM-dependent methyltransferase [Acidisoma sp.]
MQDVLPFQPNRFHTAALHYRAGRSPYPPSLIRRVAGIVPLSGRERVLDLGCGPGPLAVGFGYFAAEVIGIDPEPAMLAAAEQAAQGLVPNVRFRQGSSYDLGPEIGRFRLVTMGRSFHWMDRAATLRQLDELIEPGGAITLFKNSHLRIPENAWVAEWRAVIDPYGARDAHHAALRAEGRVPHETILLASPFSELESVSVIGRQVVTAESLIDRTLSMSSTSREKLGDAANELVEKLRALFERLAPDGSLTEVMAWTALMARRPSA